MTHTSIQLDIKDSEGDHLMTIVARYIPRVGESLSVRVGKSLVCGRITAVHWAAECYADGVGRINGGTVTVGLEPEQQEGATNAR